MVTHRPGEMNSIWAHQQLVVLFLHDCVLLLNKNTTDAENDAKEEEKDSRDKYLPVWINTPSFIKTH